MKEELLNQFASRTGVEPVKLVDLQILDTESDREHAILLISSIQAGHPGPPRQHAFVAPRSEIAKHARVLLKALEPS